MQQDRLQIEWLDKKDHHPMYAKYALMELACQDEIDFVKTNPSSFNHNILPPEVKNDLRPSQSFFIARQGNQQCRVILDCSESYLFLSPAISNTDLYFCSSYTTDMFRNHTFLKPYPWQEKYDLTSYHQHFARIEDQFGESFHKVLPFIPLPMVMDIPARLFGRLDQARIVLLMLAGRAAKKLSKVKLTASDPELHLLRMRFKQLEDYRKNGLQYDIVLRDALWGWPRHRLRLHQVLQELPGRNIFTSLSVPDPDDVNGAWRQVIPEAELDDAIELLKKRVDFPRPYEEMLTSSRLAVFATGKHWGSRMITFVSLLCGGPIMMDQPVYEPYFPMTEFKINYLKKDWSEIDSVLKQIDYDTWCSVRQHNQQVFDKYLAPLPLARYVCQAVRNWFENGHKSIVEKC